MSLLEVCAELVKHFRLRPWEIERLDRWWIAHVYFAPRDEHGTLRVEPKGGAEPKTPRDYHRELGRSWGWPDWYEEKRWLEGQRALERRR